MELRQTDAKIHPVFCLFVFNFSMVLKFLLLQLFHVFSWQMFMKKTDDLEKKKKK